MNKKISVLLMLGLLMISLFPAGAIAGEDVPEQAAPEAAVPEDNLVTTRHTAVIQGEEIDYTVTAGTMGLQTGGEVCEIFFRAYTRDGIENIAERPITFAFNGGP